MRALFRAKKTLYVLIMLCMFVGGLVFMTQVAGFDQSAGVLWAGYSAGFGGQIDLMWDVVRFSISRVEPAWSLAKQVHFWSAAPWAHNFYRREISVPRERSYGTIPYGESV